MSRYNIQTLSFLIGSFNQMKSTFGENSKTVGFFRSQVEGLVDIKQVSVTDAYLIFDLIGMSNTDNVKWEISNKRVQMFITAMNQMLALPDNSVKAYILNNLLTKNVITKDIYRVIIKVFDLKPIETIKSESKSNFGVLKSINTKQDDCTNLMKQKWNLVLSECKKDYKVRVKNPNAVCCGDPYYLYVNIDKFLDSDLLSIVIKGVKFDIGYEIEVNDPCRPSRKFTVDENVTSLANEIDFEALRLQMFKLD